MATQNKHSQQARLARLERTLERQWRSLVFAEQHGRPAATLERMYAAYLRTLDAYIICTRARDGQAPASRLAS